VEERRTKKLEKLTFVRKHFPGCAQTPGGSVKLRDETTDNRLHTTLGLDLRQPGTETTWYLDNLVVSGTVLNFSPNAKRKLGGDIFENYFSPSKKLKFRKVREFWKSSESSNL
jgi:hypothetical protein